MHCFHMQSWKTRKQVAAFRSSAAGRLFCTWDCERDHSSTWPNNRALWSVPGTAFLKVLAVTGGDFEHRREKTEVLPAKHICPQYLRVTNKELNELLMDISSS